MTRFIDTVMLAVVVVAVVCFVGLYRVAHTPDPLVPCPALYHMAHTSTDSLFIAVNRGDCTP